MKPRILCTVPWLKEVLWGAGVLQARFGKQAPAELRLGESWEVSAIPGHACGLEGLDEDLLAAWARDPAWFTGGPTDGSFPLLVKLLSTSDLLSVQVHPDDEQALRLEGEPCGKHEAWLVLEAADDAFIYLGLAEGAGARDLQQALQAGTSAALRDVLRRVHVRAGEVYDIAPGTLHAIGPGLTLLEVQQPSDATYRVFDWERLDLGGKPRMLHVEKALQVVDPHLRPGPVEPRGPASGVPGKRLLETPAFTLERWVVEGALSAPGGELTVLVSLGEPALVGGGGGPAVELPRGATCVVPAGVDRIEIRASGGRLAAIRPACLS